MFRTAVFTLVIACVLLSSAWASDLYRVTVQTPEDARLLRSSHLDPLLALQDGYSTSGRGLGSGLPAVRRLMDTLEIETAVGQGTRVRATRWLRRPTDWLRRWLQKEPGP